MGVNLIVQIPDALFEEARAAGILNSKRIAALLAMELRRMGAFERGSRDDTRGRRASVGR